MGLFSSKSTTKDELIVPDWMRGMAPELADRAMGMLDPSMTPEERIAGLSDAEIQAMTQAIAGSNLTQDNIQQLQQAGNTALQGIPQGMDMMSAAIGMGPAQNMGPDMDMAAMIADNPYMDSMINAALRDPTRQLQERDLTGSSLAQALSGNTGSTRGAIGDAVLQRGFEDRAADVSAGLRGNSYNMGTGIAANVSAQNAGLMNQFQQLMGNTGASIANMGFQGADLYGLAQNLGVNDINALMATGGLERMIDQSMRDFEYQDPFTRLGFTSSLINPMASQYGTHKSTTKSSPSIAGMGLQAAGMMMGMPSLPGMGGGGSGFDPTGMVSYDNVFPRV